MTEPRPGFEPGDLTILVGRSFVASRGAHER
jgi:hypothetical protein